jgi:iron complex transport system substrate-binding protein
VPEKEFVSQFLKMPDYTPKRIVSLQPSATAILAAIGELHRVAACTKYCAEVCPEIKTEKILIVADSWTAQSEQIMDAHPDLVIAAVPYQERAVAEILKAGIRFLGLAPHNLSDIYTDIMTIAGIVGVPDQGRKVVREMQGQIEMIRERTVVCVRPHVFCEEWGKPLIASQPWVKELVVAAGGEFVGTPGAKTSAQSVLAEDPEVLVFAWCGAGDRVPLDKTVRQRGWEGMRAVRLGRVYCVNDEFLNTPAPTLVNGLRALAFAIHPEIFPQPHGLRCISAE